MNICTQISFCESCFHVKLSIFSAAKAPFLARFKVKRCGINELEHLALRDEQEQEQSPDDPPAIQAQSKYWQACIFKVGDDVRQVSQTAVF